LAAASLKLLTSRLFLMSMPDFRGQLAAASLKLGRIVPPNWWMAAFPRPIGRGLIEAGVGLSVYGWGDEFPRPIGRGLIEANLFSRKVDCAITHFRGQLAAASLKHLSLPASA